MLKPIPSITNHLHTQHKHTVFLSVFLLIFIIIKLVQNLNRSFINFLVHLNPLLDFLRGISVAFSYPRNEKHSLRYTSYCCFHPSFLDSSLYSISVRLFTAKCKPGVQWSFQLCQRSARFCPITFTAFSFFFFFIVFFPYCVSIYFNPKFCIFCCISFVKLHKNSFDYFSMRVRKYYFQVLFYFNYLHKGCA